MTKGRAGCVKVSRVQSDGGRVGKDAHQTVAMGTMTAGGVELWGRAAHSTAQRSIWQRNRDSRDRDMTVASTTTATADSSSSNAHRTTLTPSYTVTTNVTQCTLLNLQCK